MENDLVSASSVIWCSCPAAFFHIEGLGRVVPCPDNYFAPRSSIGNAEAEHLVSPQLT